MNTFLAIVLVAAMAATLFALVRGIIAFLQESTANVRNGDSGPTSTQLKSNKMMQQRIFFQALAVIIVVVLLMLNGRTG